MPIDHEAALAAAPSVRQISWTRRDVLLYHLSLGAGRHAETDPELGYTYERDLQVLPTFAAVAGQGISAGDVAAPGLDLPGIDIDLRRILHAGQSHTVHRPLPQSGRATVTTRIAEVWDKGKAAVVVLESAAVDHDGDPLWTSRMQIWARGEGGFGGEPGPDDPWQRPERAPDRVIDTPTVPGQALLYRLNGDLNPLHADPEFAKTAGFERPILHGLATYGVVAKALVDHVLDGDPTRLTSIAVRFAGIVVPGEVVRTSLWHHGDRITFVATCPDRADAPVLTHASAEVRS